MLKLGEQFVKTERILFFLFFYHEGIGLIVDAPAFHALKFVNVRLILEHQDCRSSFESAESKCRMVVA